MFRTASLAGLLALGLNAALIAGPEDAGPTMKAGDPAPKIDIAHWLKGDAITEFEPGKVYVLEFWATWCGPCKAGMPHLSKLQAEYKDYGVSIIGISDEPLQTVVGFLLKDDWNKKTAYTVTTDPDESVKKAYFKAAGRTGIPSAFIVGKTGKVEWIGHPTQMDGPLDAIVKDSWDRDAYVKAESIRVAYQQAMRSGDQDKAMTLLDELIATDPAPQQYMLAKFQMLVTSENAAQAYPVGEAYVKRAWDDAQMLNAIAWFVVDNPKVKSRDLAFAEHAALRAADLTKNEDPAILDTVARVYFERGDLNSAIHWQQMAAEKAGDDPMGASIRKTLEEYEGARKKK